jgi:hypothetical protein
MYLSTRARDIRGCRQHIKGLRRPLYPWRVDSKSKATHHYLVYFNLQPEMRHLESYILSAIL